MTDRADSDSDTSGRPNLVLVHCHDLGQHLGCYGADVDTPNIDRIAADGARMANSFCTAPQCSPSRSSMMTGYYPHENGVMGLAHMGWALGDDWETLPKRLRSAGYDTALLGFQHEVPDEPERLGYDYVDSGTKRALELVDVVDDFFAERADDDEPFLVSIGIEEPHRPFRREYLPDETYEGADPDAVDLDDFPYLPDEPGVREDAADLTALIEEVLDPAVGRYRESLADAGLAEETVFVFTTDHGLAIPRAKGTCYDPGIETALLVHQPGAVEGGEVHDALVTNADFTPTMLDLLGVEPPTDVSGESFAPLLRGEPHDERDRIFAEMTWHDRYNPIRAIRTERYKYVRNFSVLPKVFVPMDVAPTASGREVHEEFHVPQRPAEELYDLEADPDESENLASDKKPFEPAAEASDPNPAHVDALDRLRDELESWMVSTDDPLLDGPVPYPDIE
ncbi:sulfatase family protein [Halorubrum distributum]|uniref:N-sulfoglucosamine sulfohydrolase n=1 Tax=Halorubrum distributum JCM 13916 TaxID=1230455 RepID=M0PQI5_9EURY|nr:sulfatase [Halorubrum arcis]EMA72267.1 N-sulfoglucosamine sulfohydrolase [Halorubrum arcis JCM 13916]